MICGSLYLLVFLRNLLVHLAEKILLIQPLTFGGITPPTLTIQKNMDAPVAIAHPGLTDLLDPFLDCGLIGASGPVVKRRAVKTDGPTGRPDRHRPNAAHPTNQFAQATRPQIFRRMTSCNISWSSVRSATIFFSRLFSSSSCFSRFISCGSKPAYFFFQLK